MLYLLILLGSCYFISSDEHAWRLADNQPDTPATDDSEPIDTGPVDLDGDGAAASVDCDDEDPSVFPGAVESCNSKDDDCDTLVDEAGGTTWYADADGDGEGDPDAPTVSCAAPPDSSADGTDCDDTNAAVRSSAAEMADGLDNDCDGLTDEGTTRGDDDDDGQNEEQGDCDDADPGRFGGADELPDAIDNDCDGVIDEGTEIYDDDGDTVSELDGDCDDGDADTYPAAPELPDGRDNNCDGVTDEGTEVFDDDLDGYTETDGDCDDSDPGAWPDAAELPDGVDNSCDGLTDEGTELYDDDGDGLTESDGDCDDSAPDTWPGATELADSVVNDCDGTVDEGTERYDDDLDGYSEEAGDCDDTNPSVATNFAEVADGIDNDCDGVADEGTNVFDDDLDGMSEDEGDCDDARPEVYFGAPEQVDGLDNNCDGIIEGPSAYDDDGDGQSEDAGDCDDTNAVVFSGNVEQCNGIDDDCDGMVDINATDATFWYLDADIDGWGDTLSLDSGCESPEGAVSVGGDCDDEDSRFYPGAAESCEDREDLDCDRATSWSDADGDGYGVCEECDDTNRNVSPAAAELCSTSDDDNCDGEVNEAGASGCGIVDLDADGDGWGVTTCVCDSVSAPTAPEGDCDDDAWDAYPGATEACGDATDEDCNGVAAVCGAVGAMELEDVATFVVFGAGVSQQLGGTINPGGDLNGDGYGDLVVGSKTYSTVHVFFSPLSGGHTAGGDDVTIISGSTSDRLADVRSTGDIDGDGDDDLYVGLSGSGRGVLLFGPLSSDRSTATPDVTLTGPSFGYDSLSGTDHTGDGQTDLLIYGDSAVSLFAGPITADLTHTTDTWSISGSSGTAFGRSMDGGKDFDGDGVDDLVIGASGATTSGNAQSGAAYLFFGPVDSDLSSGGADFSVRGPHELAYLGEVALLDDTDGDGLAELAVGGWGVVGPWGLNTGAVYLYAGGSTGSAGDDDAMATVWGEFESSMGLAVASAGDADGDGFGDLSVGAYGWNGAYGRVYVALAPFSGAIDVVSSWAILDGSRMATLGATIVDLGDLDGSGVHELGISAPYDSTGFSYGGAAYVLDLEDL